MQKERLHKAFNKKIVVVTGELSGEMHAFHLIRALRESLDAQFSGIGSKRLEGIGVTLVYDYKNISLTGFSEIFLKLKYVYQAFKRLKEHIAEIRPSLLILVDFPGFNLRIARFAKKRGIPVVYFIPPQIWAWRKRRIHTIKKFVDKVICILPFEKALYEAHGVDATYIGHPFINTVRPTCARADFMKMIGQRDGDHVITVMPGSRINEIRKHMPLLTAVIDILEEKLDRLTILLPLAENIEHGDVEMYQKDKRTIIPLKGLSYDALSYCDIAIVASGSATLEAAILGTPTIVIYRISPISYLLAKILVKVKYISLPNIIAGKEVFPEFVQHVSAENIAEKVLYMVRNGREGMKEDIDRIRMRLGTYDSYLLAKNNVIEVLEHFYGTLSKTA